VITHIAGAVFVIRGDLTVPAFPGERLEPGDIVKVTEGALAQVQLADRGSALLGSDTLVRFLKLTGADQQLELRTEILTGSLSYRVEKLDDSERIVIEADGTEYEVRGTEFVIEKLADGTLLVVGAGTVAVRGNVSTGSVTVGPDEELVVIAGGEPGQVRSITAENRERLEAAAPLPAMPFGFMDAPKPVRVEISAEPPDSDIYIDGLRTGTGRFRGLLPEGTLISVRVRRRGFSDYAFEMKADSDQFIEVQLVPLDLEETLSEEKPVNPMLERLRTDYEQRLAELSRSFAEQGSLSAEEQARFAAERAQREADLRAAAELERARAKILETELIDSRAQNEQLKDLIRQIQELTEE
jgi:ferric-dicitrate binding protein FerR (iron transport regulator)